MIHHGTNPATTTGAPRPMKMCTIASPWRYDLATAQAIWPDDLRQTAILRYASWPAVFPISRGPAPDAHAGPLKLPPSNYFLGRDPGAGFAPSCLGECAIAARHEPEHRIMWYRKNVGGWERAARLIGGGLMLICGVVALHASPLGLLLSGAGVVTLVTGVFGFCPACAVAGRKQLKG